MHQPPLVRFLDRATPPHILTLILLAGISALSMNIFLPSLPSMTRYFDTEYRIVQLSVALYLGVNALLQVIVGPISDRYGRRPVVLWTLAIFTLASIGCVLAPNIEIFLAFRMVQAVVVGGLVLSRAVVRDMVPQDQAASMIGYVTMGMSVAPMLAPALGGVLDGIFGWKASFWSLAALGAIIGYICWRDLGETMVARPVSFRAQVAEYPELLRSRRFWGYCAAAAFASGAFFAYLGGAPFVGSEVFGLTPSALGIYFGAPAIGYMAGNYISGRYSVRFGINAMILWGAILSAFGLWVSMAIFLAGHGSVGVFFGFMTFVGLGNGMVLPNATSGMLSVRPHLAGTASGLGGAMMIGGGAALSALAGALLTPGTGALPLIAIMAATSLLAVLSILYTIHRERSLES
ncbi:multidrug effflux MFS transporter [Profundibacterium mesophilum]|uniref:Bcr/CflA family efflux transporter n=1 Tax=Profundibacterium mesophilum KAUST100406-0324 TaxID=1037889 RepID=A0A921TBD6_9RHOB|nr:multidrug effflux MFS transporter [Profundibacterium mesophilum]KAF0675420.1 MFS permease [Profundibacterium mesophilum KAUST100406-0324]